MLSRNYYLWNGVEHVVELPCYFYCLKRMLMSRKNVELLSNRNLLWYRVLAETELDLLCCWVRELRWEGDEEGGFRISWWCKRSCSCVSVKVMVVSVLKKVFDGATWRNKARQKEVLRNGWRVSKKDEWRRRSGRFDGCGVSRLFRGVLKHEGGNGLW